MSFKSRYAISCGLHDAKLLDLLYLLLRCWTFPASCQDAWRPVKHVMLFDLAFKMLHCLLSFASCYAASPPSLLPVAGWFSISDLGFLVTWSCFHDAKPAKHFWTFSSSCYVLDLSCLMWSLVFKMLCWRSSLRLATLLHQPPQLL